MKEIVKLILVVTAALVSLYTGMWFLIFLIGMAYGYLTSWGTWKSGFASLIAVFGVWSIAILLRDANFAHSPMELFAGAVGGLPIWLVPVVGGAIGGIVSFLGTIGARLLRNI